MEPGSPRKKHMEVRIMDYQKEYATLVGQVDRAISMLELCPSQDPVLRGVRQLLTDALLQAEERFIANADS